MLYSHYKPTLFFPHILSHPLQLSVRTRTWCCIQIHHMQIQTNYQFVYFYSDNSTIQKLVIKGHFTYYSWFQQVESQHIHIYAIMVCGLNQRHHTTKPSSPCLIPIMLSIRLGSDKYQLKKVIGWTQSGFKLVRSGFEPAKFRFPNLPEWEVGALLIWPPHHVM